MNSSNTRVLPFSDESVDDAARLILAGQPVAVATETVYGLAADATNPHAVARIYAAKGRPSFNPLIVHVPNLSAAEHLATFPFRARRLAQQYWPGPLTLVLPRRDDAPLASIVSAGLPTVAIRVPRHPAMQALLRASGRPLAAPSANASGSISPTRAGHVMRSLGGRIPLILDAGPTQVGVESTVVAVDGDELRLLRFGPIDLGLPMVVGDKVQAPGMLARHYAPSKPLRLDATDARPGEYLIGFGPVQGDASLSSSGDLIESAARLFDLLHQADAADADAIAVAPIPSEGMGLAIRDRLRRAAHRGA